MFKIKYALKNIEQASKLLELLIDHTESLPIALIKQQMIEIRTNIELAKIKLKEK